jgi:hypothetical protein
VKIPGKLKRLEPVLKSLQPKPPKPTKPKPEVKAARQGRPEGKFDKVKYQRELMRKRRAQKRDAATRT